MDQNETPSQRRRRALDRVAGFICKDRQNQYGDAEDNFRNIAFIWTWWLQKRGLMIPDKEITRLDVCQMMSLMKACRKLNNLLYQDNWDDSVGYEAIGSALAEFEREMLELEQNKQNLKRYRESGGQ